MSIPKVHGRLNDDCPQDITDLEFNEMPESVQMILRSVGMRAIDTMQTCHNCGCVTEIGRRCDNCGRIV